MPSLHVNGAALDYEERGRGEPLVLVHGSASDRRTWDGPLRALAARHHAVAYSRRFHWPNEPIAPGAGYAMADHVADLAGVLDALGLRSAHLVGHSYGALVALFLALRAPGRVRSLVLVEPPALTLFVGLPPGRWETLRLFLRRPRTAAGIVRFGKGGFEPAAAALQRGATEEAIRRFGTAILGEEAFAALTPDRLDQVRANFVGAELLESSIPPLAADPLRRLRVPTLLLAGDRSPALFRRLLERLAELLPDARRAVVVGASHLVHEDAPAAFDAALRAFLGRRSPARASSR